MIYAVRRLIDGKVKLGCASHLPSRFSNLKRQYGDIEVLGVDKGGREQEQELHDRFAEHRIYRSANRNSPNYPLIATDWFEPVGELLAWVAENMKRYPPQAAQS